jgi:hypothetical protein
MEKYHSIQELANELILQQEQAIYDIIDYNISNKDYINNKIAEQQSKGKHTYYVFMEKHNKNVNYYQIFKNTRNHEGMTIIERLRYLYQPPFNVTYCWLTEYGNCYIKIKWKRARCTLI